MQMKNIFAGLGKDIALCMEYSYQCANWENASTPVQLLNVSAVLRRRPTQKKQDFTGSGTESVLKKGFGSG